MVGMGVVDENLATVVVLRPAWEPSGAAASSLPLGAWVTTPAIVRPETALGRPSDAEEWC